MHTYPPTGVPDTIIIKPRFYTEQELDWFAEDRQYVLPDGTTGQLDGIDVRERARRVGINPKRIPRY